MRQITKLSAGAMMLGLLAVPVIGQDAEKTDKRAPATKQKDASSEKDDSSSRALSAVRVRLPRYFGKLDLSESQREKVRAVQARYNEEILALQQQLTELRSKREKEAAKVLTKAQRTKLKDLVAAARSRRGQIARNSPTPPPKADEP